VNTPQGATTTAPGATCAHCGEALEEGFAFCEGCGTPTGLGPTGGGPVEASTSSVGPREVESDRTLCSCGGRFEDGWCDTCGAPEPDGRDHVVTTISASLGCVSDRGLHHPANEDAGSVVDLGRAAACVVADGVSTAKGSQAAATAAVEATCDALLAAAVGDVTAWTDVLASARTSAATAAVAVGSRVGGDPSEAPSCTWAAAIASGNEIWATWVGDSRIYVVGDDGRGRALSIDHSWAAEAIAAGVGHDTAMADPRAHMITAWLGADAPELPNATVHTTFDGPGWLIVCSDGLWNYCDDAEELSRLIARLGGHQLEATALAEALVGFACAAGGSDNVTVAATRLGGGSEGGGIHVDRGSEPTRPGE